MGTLFMWICRIYLGLWATGIIGIMVVAPGVYAAREIKQMALDLRASKLEERMTVAWSRCAGVLFSMTIGFFIAMMIFGPIASVKLWFVGLCYMVVMVPWIILGCVGRRIVRRIAPPSDEYAKKRIAEGLRKAVETLPKNNKKSMTASFLDSRE